eukprot:c7939_g1_i1 orf=42-221(-)
MAASSKSYIWDSSENSSHSCQLDQSHTMHIWRIHAYSKAMEHRATQTTMYIIQRLVDKL